MNQIQIYAAALLIAGTSLAAEPPKAPVPPSPFLPVIYRFADAMLEHGRDTYGPQKSGLFLSALDRATLAPLTNRPAASAGVRDAGRVGADTGALAGANPQHDENLLRLLFTLSELSSKPKYREAADAELKWLLQITPAREALRLPWGEHLSWNVMTDETISKNDSGQYEFFRPWLLWDRCFDLAPEASQRLALGLWERQIAHDNPGALDRLPGVPKQRDRAGIDSPRQAGFAIRTWAVAYAQTKNERFLRAIEAWLERFEKKRHPKTGWIETFVGSTNASVPSSLSLAIDCDGAAHRVPEPLASRLRAFAAREDAIVCGLPHNLKTTGGFVTELNRATGQSKEIHTPLWTARHGGYTTAQIGMMCVSRYENTGKTGYRDLIRAAADVYLQSFPPENEDVWPATLGHAISLELAAWRSTANQVYLDRARALANFALEKIFDQSPLPRASLKSEHYETITGADTLALALVELHLHILHITAVRYPPNTIDR